MKSSITRGCVILALTTAPLLAEATTYSFNAILNGANELVPTGSTATGLGFLAYDDNGTPLLLDDDTYDFTLSAFGLSSPLTGYHIHALANTSQNASVVVNLQNAPFFSLVSGNNLLVGGNDIAPPPGLLTGPTAGPGGPHTPQPFLSALQNQLAYINVHTTMFTGGEIRGQLVPVAAIPEPSTYALMLAGLGFVGFVANRRRKSQVDAAAAA